MRSNAPPKKDRISGGRSLAMTLQALARNAGLVLDLDELSATLGHSMLICAASGTTSLDLWPLHARNAYLVDTGLLFGIELRGIHPPEAAVGLSYAAEFSQHFDASYRPLILRALENDQPVLAWSAMSEAGQARGIWGLVESVQSELGDFAGLSLQTFGEDGSSEVLSLDHPPVQLYVAESVNPVSPEPESVLTTSLRHTRAFLSNDPGGKLEVVTGPQAYNQWIARLDAPDNSATKETELTAGYLAIITSALSDHRAGSRFFSHSIKTESEIPNHLRETLANACQDVVSALSQWEGAPVLAEALQTKAGRSKLASDIAKARASANKALTALDTWQKKAQH